MIFALVNPYKSEADRTANISDKDVVLVLDISNSMLANDVSPNRLEQARAFSDALSRDLAGSGMALILMAGAAWVQIPLTTDLDAVKIGIQSAHPQMAPRQGTTIAGAVSLSARILENAPRTSGKAVVLVSDGENHGESVRQALRKLKAAKITAFCVGVGTEDGGYIPVETDAGPSYKTDAKGIPVLTRLDASNLKRLSPGHYYLLNAYNAQAISQAISKRILKTEKGGSSTEAAKNACQNYQIFLLLALAFMLLGLWCK